MNVDKKVKKGMIKIANICAKYFENLNLADRYNQIKLWNITPNKSNYKYLFTSEEHSKYLKREVIMNTLLDIGYIRDGEWSTYTVVAFLHEVFESIKVDIEDDQDNYKELLESISYRYNVPINRINTQVALFITNLNRGNDKFELNEYFSRLEILLWKYRDPEKLKADIELNKLEKKDLQLIKKYYNI